MALKVQVPTDFGRHLLGCPTHSNLVILAKDGEEMTASSVILSFNSPVIEHITTVLGLTSLDCKEFDAAAVDSFVLSCYVGELECKSDRAQIKSMFRDINKMAQVFDVAWLLGKCCDYFKEMLKVIDGENFNEMLYLFEEAKFFLDNSKSNKNVLMDLTVEKIQKVNGTETFVSNYFKNYNNFTEKQIDLMIHLAGNEVEIVVKYLLVEISTHIDGHGAFITDNTKYLLANSDLSLCRNNDRMLFESLFDTLQGLQNISNDDMKEVFSLYRKSSSEKKSRIGENPSPNNTSSSIDDGDVSSIASPLSSDIDASPLSSDSYLPDALISSKMPNLFQSIETFDGMSFNEMFSELAESPNVVNLFMFAEGLWTWMDEHISTCSHNLYLNRFMKDVAQVMIKRKWGGIPFSYISSWQFGTKKRFKFFTILKNCNSIVDALDSLSLPYTVIPCCTPATVTWQQLFETEIKFRFKFVHPDIGECSRSGNCGFILKTNSVNPQGSGPDNLFDIELTTDPVDYKGFKLHFHNEVMSADNMYFVVERMYGDVPCFIPISWCGQPSFREKYWNWGQFKFPNDSPVRISILYAQESWMIGLN